MRNMARWILVAAAVLALGGSALADTTLTGNAYVDNTGEVRYVSGGALVVEGGVKTRRVAGRSKSAAPWIAFWNQAVMMGPVWGSIMRLISGAEGCMPIWNSGQGFAARFWWRGRASGR